MKINLVEVPRPMVSSFTMFADPDLNLLRETKTIRVSFHHHTKTRISTSIQFGEYCVKVNKFIKEYKQHEDTDWNYFSGNKVTSYYFVKSKKQNYDVYKEYVIKLIDDVIRNHIKLELDEITIQLEQREF
jgi:hypothetical protein